MTPTSTPTRRPSLVKKDKKCENANTNRIHKEMWHRLRQYKTFMASSLAKTFLYPHRESTMSRRNTKVKPSSSWSKNNNKSIFRANIWVSLCQISRKKPRNYIHFEFGFFKSFFNWVGFIYVMEIRPPLGTKCIKLQSKHSIGTALVGKRKQTNYWITFYWYKWPHP